MLPVRLLVVADPGAAARVCHEAEAAGVRVLETSFEALEDVTDDWPPPSDGVVALVSNGAPKALHALRRLEAPLFVVTASEDDVVNRHGSDPFGAENLGIARLFSPDLSAHEIVREVLGFLAVQESGAQVWLERLAAGIDDALEVELRLFAGLPAAAAPADTDEPGADRPAEPTLTPAASPGDEEEPAGRAPAAIQFVEEAAAVFHDQTGASGSAEGRSRPSFSPLLGRRTSYRAGPTRRRGRLDEDHPALLVGRAFVEAVTGRLVLSAETTERSIYFEAGRPVLATSNDPSDRMVELLSRRGRLHVAERERAEALAESSGRRMGAVLVDLGLLKGAELLPIVREHYEEIILASFSWPAGTWRLEPGVTADPTRVRLLRHPASLVKEGLVRVEFARLAALLGPAGNVFSLDIRGVAREALFEAFGFLPRERKIAALFDGLRTFEEVARAGTCELGEVERVALALLAFGLLGAAQNHAGGPTDERLRQRDRRVDIDRVDALHALARDGDYFQLLGLDRGADAAEVRRSYERLTRELSNEALGPTVASGMAAELAELREVLAEAARLLGSDRLRALYCAALPSDARPSSSSPTIAR